MSFEELMQDAEFAAKLETAEDLASIVSLLKTKGIEITEEELEKAVKMAAESDGELSEDALEDVAGGGFFSTLRIIIRAIQYKAGGGGFSGGGGGGGAFGGGGGGGR